jgi:hypothetical protein
MKYEAVSCPVKLKVVKVSECYTCSNFIRRVRGKVGCRGERMSREITVLTHKAAHIPKRQIKGRLRETYHCVICEAPAVRAGDSVICTADSSHVFPLECYQIQIIPMT